MFLVQDDATENSLRIEATSEIANLDDLPAKIRAFTTLVVLLDEADARMVAAREIINLGDTKAANNAFVYLVHFSSGRFGRRQLAFDDNLAAREIAKLGDIELAKKAFVSLVEAEGIDEHYRMEAAQEIIALGDAKAAYRAITNYLGDGDFLDNARQWFQDRGLED